MDKKHLFKIREKRGIELANIFKYRDILKDVFSDVNAVPFVYGPSDFSPKQWELRTLSPIAQSDRLTLSNYLVGVDEVCNKFKDFTNNEMRFRYADLSLGIENRTKDEIARDIITTSFNIEGMTYNLRVAWMVEPKNGQDENGYTAHSAIYTPKVCETMNRFIGPNTHHLD
jgi:hypothetical protein